MAGIGLAVVVTGHLPGSEEFVVLLATAPVGLIHQRVIGCFGEARPQRQQMAPAGAAYRMPRFQSRPTGLRVEIAAWLQELKRAFRQPGGGPRFQIDGTSGTAAGSPALYRGSVPL